MNGEKLKLFNSLNVHRLKISSLVNFSIDKKQYIVKLLKNTCEFQLDFK